MNELIDDLVLVKLINNYWVSLSKILCFFKVVNKLIRDVDKLWYFELMIFNNYLIYYLIINELKKGLFLKGVMEIVFW